MKPSHFVFWFVLTLWFLVQLADTAKGAEHYRQLFAYEAHPSATYQFGDVWFGVYNSPEPRLLGWIAPSRKADYALIEIHYDRWLSVDQQPLGLPATKHLTTRLIGKNRIVLDRIDLDIGQIAKVKVIYLNVVGTSEKDLKP